MYYIYLACKVTDCVTCTSSSIWVCSACTAGKKLIALPFFDGSTLALTQKCIFLYKK